MHKNLCVLHTCLEDKTKCLYTEVFRQEPNQEVAFSSQGGVPPSGLIWHSPKKRCVLCEIRDPLVPDKEPALWQSISVVGRRPPSSRCVEISNRQTDS